MDGSGDLAKLYIDGIQAGASVDISGLGSVTNAEPFTIGSHGGPGKYFNGILDEVRISSVLRDAQWVETEYNNQSSPSTFYLIDCPCATSP